MIVEYDALRGTSEDYHGCQHNAQSPVGFAAAFAMAEHMAEEGGPGTLRIYGTPAERLMLHAEALRFRHPVTGQPIHLECASPF